MKNKYLKNILKTLSADWDMHKILSLYKYVVKDKNHLIRIFDYQKHRIK